jgi:hypothetical protein
MAAERKNLVILTVFSSRKNPALACVGIIFVFILKSLSDFIRRYGG